MFENSATLGGLFAFDGSLSVLFACLGKSTRVHWADQRDLTSLFEDDRMTDLLVEEGMWMRSVANQDANLDLESSFRDYETDGATYKSIPTELYLDNARLR